MFHRSLAQPVEDGADVLPRKAAALEGGGQAAAVLGCQRATPQLGAEEFFNGFLRRGQLLQRLVP